jgi:hypothetical protein
MLNTTKLLYILPDVAYVAELLAGKKPHAYSVHAFRQINGEFLEKNAFIGKNILKLFSKLEEGEYTLILPDVFFTNTIVSVAETDDAKIQEYITSTTLPQLKLSNETHHLESYVLTEFKGASQVQIAALDKKRLAPIRAALSQTSVTLAATISISWSIKSLISLEPSASVMQVGTELYAAKQYIGIDETSSASVTDAQAIAEAIKVLKGSDTNLQTVYLLSNELVQETLKEELSSVIPIQQLASQKDDDTQMPNYIRQCIEAAGRTLSIKEYPVPRFVLDTASDADLKAFNIESLASDAATESTTSQDEADEETAEDTLPMPAAAPTHTPPIDALAADAEELPEIPMIGEEADEEDEVLEDAAQPDEEKDNEAGDDLADNTADQEGQPEDLTEADEPSEVEKKNIAQSSDESDSVAALLKTTLAASATATTTAAAAATNPATVAAASATASTPATISESAVDSAEPADSTDSEPQAVTPSPLITPAPKVATPAPAAASETDSIDLSKFSNHAATAIPAGKPLGVAASTLSSPQKTTIKNKGGVQNMLKMILITTAVFIVTVAVGVGVGLGILSLTNKGTAESPVVVESPAPVAEATPEPTPEATPAAALAKGEIDVLVVNATTKAGYAGTISDLLKEYGTVRSGNARGRYATPGMYVSFKAEVPGLLEALQEDTKLTLKIDEAAVKTEDAAGTYDAVIILAE